MERDDNAPMKIRLRSLLARPWLLMVALSSMLMVAGCGMFHGSQPAPSLPDPASAVTLVVYHVHLGDKPDDFTDHIVYLDGASMGRLNDGEELRLKVAPGVHELRVQPELMWVGGARQEPVKYSLELAKGTTRYVRYRTAVGEGRLTTSGFVIMDRELHSVTEQDYTGKR